MWINEMTDDQLAQEAESAKAHARDRTWPAQARRAAGKRYAAIQAEITRRTRRDS